jgi:hypothetical protein
MCVFFMCYPVRARGRRGGNPGDYPARRTRLEAVDGEFEVYLRVCSRCGQV